MKYAFDPQFIYFWSENLSGMKQRASKIFKKSVRLLAWICLLYTSDAADERSSVDLGGRRTLKKKKNNKLWGVLVVVYK